MNINLDIDDKKFKGIVKTLKYAPVEVKKGVVSALNRTVISANKNLQRQIVKNYNIKKEQLEGNSQYKSDESNNLIQVRKANFKNLSACIYVRGRRLTLFRFIVKPTDPQSNKGCKMKQIKKRSAPIVKIYKGKRKVLDKKHNAFVAKTKDKADKPGIVSIFRRLPNGNLGMLRTTSVPQMARNKDIIKVVESKAKEQLSKRVNHEIEYRFNKIIKKNIGE